jgi:glycine/D-amino acid oxidase-like deaminating enzyme
VIASDQLKDSRIVVIGAGAIGALVSYRLAQAGAQVTTVERLYPGSGITGRSFAWINGHEKPPQAYHRLNIRSIRDHEELADELGGRWVRVDGGLHWEHADEPARMQQLARTIRQLHDWGVRVDRVTPDVAMRDIAPDLWIDPQRVSEVFFIGREGVIDPVYMVHSVLHEANRRYGAKLESGDVVALRGPKGAVDEVVLRDGRTLTADIVMNCAGPDADKISALAGGYLPLAPTWGLTVSTPPAPVCLRQVVHSPEANLRPDGAGRMLIRNRQVDEFIEKDKPMPVDSPVIAEVMERARQIVPGLKHVPPETVRIGERAIPQDAISIVGFDPQVSGLYVVVTHSGITLSARLAKLVTEDLASGNAEELTPFRLSRFPVPNKAVTPA